MPYKVLITDDEPIQRKILQTYCSQIGVFECIDLAEDALQALKMLAEQAYDLLLLDINMPVLSGLGLAKLIPEKTKVIFVTAYSEHAVAAFDLEALDYLLKPVSFERFAKAIQKLQPKKEEETNAEQPISLKQGNKIFKINPSDILYLEAKGNFSRVYMADKTCIDSYVPLTQLLDMLPNADFMRVHRSFVANIAQVSAFERSCLHIQSHTIPIGHSYKKEIESKFL